MTVPLVLALETSLGPVGLALATIDGEVLASCEADNPAGTQAETLPPLAAALFAANGYRFSDIARIAVTTGPGAFTGVRVGLAFAKGLAIATGAELLGVGTLSCLAAQAQRLRPHHGVCVAVDAKREEIFLHAVDGEGKVVLAPCLLPLPEARGVVARLAGGNEVLTGSGAALVSHAGDHRILGVGRPDMRLLASRAGRFDASAYPGVPCYLRAPDARLPQ